MCRVCVSMDVWIDMCLCVYGTNRYPKEVWSKYVPSLESLGDVKNRAKAKDCLNELIIDALSHIPDVFAYMSELSNQTVFNFCAIPQVMAIATLALCYDNGDVFEGVVKIRKGEWWQCCGHVMLLSLSLLHDGDVTSLRWMMLL